LSILESPGCRHILNDRGGTTMAEFAVAINRSGCGQRRIDEVLIVFFGASCEGLHKAVRPRTVPITVRHLVRRMRSCAV
jgi:hypothetical protein